MITVDTETNEKHVFCDICEKEFLGGDNIYVLNTGDVLCKKCFDNSYRIMSVEEYLNER